MEKEDISHFINENLTAILYGDKPKDKDGNVYVYTSEDDEEYQIFLITPTGEKKSHC